MTTPTEPFPTPPAAKPDWLIIVRGLAGAIAGGVLGYFAFRWLSRNGFFSLMIPGLLLGVGAGWAARGKSIPLGVVCCVAALVLGVFSEWMRSPFNADPSFVYFVTHLGEMDAAALKFVLLGLGSVAAFWFGKGR